MLTYSWNESIEIVCHFEVVVQLTFENSANIND